MSENEPKLPVKEEVNTSENEPKLPVRRRLLQAAGLGLAGAATFGLSGLRPAHAAMGQGGPLQMRSDGSYATVPLVKDEITLSVVQTRVRAVDAKSPDKGKKDNLAHMLRAIDKVFHFRAPSDIVQFHEFPITGWDTWNREEALRLAIELPGEESVAIGKKAKEYGCYIVFGSYVRDADWPRHVLSVTTIIGPDGNIVDKHWKARNVKGMFPDSELFTTGVYDVLDEYIEMYGADAVMPVTRTPVGNLCTSSTQMEPELFRALAMKGAEIILRTATGGFYETDALATSLHNKVYATMCNNSISPENPNFFDDPSSMAGNSLIIGPNGEVLARARQEETVISARIPIKSFRQRHTQPLVHMDMFKPIFDVYQNNYGPNLFADYLPKDMSDAKAFLKDKSRWK